MCCSVHSQLHVYDSSVFIPYCFPWCWIVVASFFIFLGFLLLFTNTFFDMISFLFSLRIGRFFTYLMVCLLSTIYNWGVGSVGAAHPLEDGFTIHSQLALLCGCAIWWTGMPCMDCCIQSMPGGLLLVPAVATAGQQTRLSAQGWATLMADPFWGCDDCSQSCRSLGNWQCGQIGALFQSRGRLHAVLQLPLPLQQGN